MYPSPSRPSYPRRMEADLARVSASAVAALAVLGLLALAGCRAEQEAAPPPEPPAVGVMAVGEEKVNPFIEFVGKTRAAESVALRARVTGFLEGLGFEEGSTVQQGQVLFKIEPDEYRATLAQKEAVLGAAEASLNRARVDLDRYRELAKSRNVSQQKVDEAEAEVLVQEASVDTAKADIEKAKLNVDYTEITAPIAGRIDAAALDVGNLIGPDSGVLATINRMDPIQVTFSVAETMYLDIMKQDREHKRRTGDAERAIFVPLLRLSDGSLYDHKGSFDYIDNKVDQKTGTVLVRAEFPNPDRLLLPGQFVTVVIEREDAIDAVVIPQAAILTDQGGAYVLLVNDQDKVEARRIVTGQRFGPDLVVEEGLAPGERIILYGIQKVRPGITVKPELTAPPANPMQNSAEASGPAGGSAQAGAEAGPVASDTAGADAPVAEAITEGPAKDLSGGGQAREDAVD
jgi:membrane fusion protein (multidrug efflux system)